MKTTAEYDAIDAEHGPNYRCWEIFSDWCDDWHATHPDEDRDVLEMVDLFVSQDALPPKEG